MRHSRSSVNSIPRHGVSARRDGVCPRGLNGASMHRFGRDSGTDRYSEITLGYSLQIRRPRSCHAGRLTSPGKTLQSP